jgi:hypothetical protein
MYNRPNILISYNIRQQAGESCDDKFNSETKDTKPTCLYERTIGRSVKLLNIIYYRS